uniref:Uncharacterized protein n=1 Tax=Fagus sylvatica TaxID=28930 RepID=A0A2N9ESC4_FAGSY
MLSEGSTKRPTSLNKPPRAPTQPLIHAASHGRRIPLINCRLASSDVVNSQCHHFDYQCHHYSATRDAFICRYYHSSHHSNHSNHPPATVHRQPLPPNAANIGFAYSIPHEAQPSAHPFQSN